MTGSYGVIFAGEVDGRRAQLRLFTHEGKLLARLRYPEKFEWTCDGLYQPWLTGDEWHFIPDQPSEGVRHE